MLNIDLEFLNFLINPNESYIKDDILAIKKEYLKNSTLETLKNKLNNFSNSKPILLTTIDDLRHFLYQMNSALLEEVYYKFGKFFNIKIKNNIEGNNFIETILLDNDIDNIHEDENLIILRTKIREYLINIVNTTTNEKDKLLAQKAIKYLDNLLNKYDSIKQLLIPKEALIKEITEKRKEKSLIILKKILKEHSYLLSEEKRQILNNTSNLNIQKILHKEKLFKTFFFPNCNGEISPFHIGTLNWLKTNTAFSLSMRKNFLKENGVDLEKENIDINDIDAILKRLGYKYISNGITYEGEEILEVLEEDIKKYNELYKDEIEDYILTISMNELKEKVKELILHTYKNNNIITTENELEALEEKTYKEIINYIKNTPNNIPGFVYSIKQNKYNNLEHQQNSETEIHFQTYVLFPLRSIEISKNRNLINTFYYTLSHELGHIYTPLDNIINKYKLLCEIYNDYRSDKKTFELLCNGHFQKKGIKFKKITSTYSLLSFFLIDIFEEYREYFEEFADNDTIKPLLNLMGWEIFKDIIIDIETFKIKNCNMEEQKEKYIEKRENYLKKIKRRQLLTQTNQYDDFYSY